VTVKDIFTEKYCNVDGLSVAKQRLGKQTSTIEGLFSMGSAPRPLLCSGSVNTFKQCKTVFSMGSVQRSYLKNKRRYDSFLSSEFSVGDSHWKFEEDLWRLCVWLGDFMHVQYLECVIQWDCYSSCVLVVVQGEDLCVCVCVCKSAIALYLMWSREIVTKVVINPIIRTRTCHFLLAYHPTRDNIKFLEFKYKYSITKKRQCLSLYSFLVYSLIVLILTQNCLVVLNDLSTITKISTTIFCWGFC
jgi:hypothetical protein